MTRAGPAPQTIPLPREFGRADPQPNSAAAWSCQQSEFWRARIKQEQSVIWSPRLQLREHPLTRRMRMQQDITNELRTPRHVTGASPQAPLSKLASPPGQRLPQLEYSSLYGCQYANIGALHSERVPTHIRHKNEQTGRFW
mmetsp:Transcript_53838/g.89355  ORF Transcript_53838/g.89355 Transcript_53838/m.89355 type:complete len:141 (-) Transcript_53838:203-625(-)